MIKRTMQEWSNFTRMIGTISSSGVILLHENEPVIEHGQIVKVIYKPTGAYMAIPRELVESPLNFCTITRPEK